MARRFYWDKENLEDVREFSQTLYQHLQRRISRHPLEKDGVITGRHPNARPRDSDEASSEKSYDSCFLTRDKLNVVSPEERR